jgi:ABC-type sulfate transport system substrate-binding protein
MSPDLARHLLAVAIVALGLGPLAAVARDLTILNVSYDPTRELYQDFEPGFREAVTSPRIVTSYRVAFGASLAAALLNAFFGLIVA